jgi:solute carrier family 12 (potassium/chloride transporters), member 9
MEPTLCQGARSLLTPHHLSLWMTSVSQKDPAHPDVSTFLEPYNISWSTEHIRENWNIEWSESPQCNKGEMCSFKLMFSIIFPMATGIMEGANLSGDQKNPEKSIPTGTLYAVLTSFCTYVVLVVAFAGSFERRVLINDLNLFQNASLKTPFIVITGILISALSSGLGSLFGGSRILQAISRDKLFPILNTFGYGSKRGDEPLYAVMGTWFISQAAVLIGDLDVVAPVITSIFCLSYALVNFTCFALSISGAPNFRPMFKYWSKWTALVGFATNLFVMFFLDYKHGIIGVCILLCLVVYLTFRGPVTQWGDVSQALMFHQVRKFLLMLGDSPHSKYWRPNMLVLTDDVNSAILGFCNKIKKGGLMVVGDVIVGELHENFEEVTVKRARWQESFKEIGIKAFSHVVTSPTARTGYQFLLTCGGLGGLDINTVVLPLLRGLSKAPSGTSIHTLLQDGQAGEEARRARKGSISRREGDRNVLDGSQLSDNITDAVIYCAMLEDALLVKKNIVLTRGFGSKMIKTKQSYFSFANRAGHASSDNASDGKRNIDVWICDDWGFDQYFNNPTISDQDVMPVVFCVVCYGRATVRAGGSL